MMCETMNFVDFEKIKSAAPKWYMGYSDNTNFTFLLSTICDTAAVYGPCAGTFGMEPWHESLSDTMDVLTHTKKPQKYNLFSEYIFTALNLKTRKYIIVFDCSLVLYIICFSY